MEPARVAAAAEQSHRLLELINGTAISARAPVHWILPVALIVEHGNADCIQLVTELKARVRQRGDEILSCGYSGVTSTLLSIEEARAEISWGVRNPWYTGVEQVFGEPVATGAAPFIDPRAGVRRLYRETGLRSLLVPERL